MIVNVPFSFAEKMWPSLEPMFASVTKHTHGCYEPSDVLEDIRTGNQKLWVAWDENRNVVDAVMTTAIYEYPRRKALRIPYIAGANMRAWRAEFVSVIEKYARDEGATLLEGSFRRGWSRAWPGAKENGVSIVKELGL